MYITSTPKEKFKPFSIVIETPEEAKHLIYRLCFCACSTDPKGIESAMRILLVREMLEQGIDLSTFTEEENKLYNDYTKEKYKNVMG